MPRPRTIGDEAILGAVLALAHHVGLDRATAGASRQGENDDEIAVGVGRARA